MKNIYKLENKYELKFKNLKINLLKDIAINEEEFLNLRKIVKNNIKNEYELETSLVTARYLVEIGYLRYEEGMYWDYVFEDLEIIKNSKKEKILGTLFLETLKKNSLPYYKNNKRKQYTTNILMHTYVPINYAERFYEFLESFYENELHQIYEEILVEEELNHLELFLKRYIEYGEEELKSSGDKKPTIYKLIKPLKVSIYFTKGIFIKYIKSHLKVLDTFWWEYSEGENPLLEEEYNNLKKWYFKSKKRNKASLKQRKKKIYYKPTIILVNNDLRLQIPRQKINNEDYKGNVIYEIIQNKKIVNNGKLLNFVSMGRILTEPQEIIFNKNIIDTELVIKSGDREIKKFSLIDAPFLIFKDNENVELDKIKSNFYKIYSDKDFRHILNENIESYRKGFNEIDLTEESVIEINGEEYFLNKTNEYKIIGEKIDDLRLQDDEKLIIYKDDLYIKLKKNLDINNLRLDMNDIKYKLSNYLSNVIETNNSSCLSLRTFVLNNNKYKIKLIDIENNKILFTKEVFILNIYYFFNKNSYFFEKNALLKLDIIKNIKHAYKKSNNEYLIPLKDDKVRFSCEKNKFNIKIPLFKWKLNDSNWRYDLIETWHEEFKGNLILNVPFGNKAFLLLDDQEIKGFKGKHHYTFNIDKFQDTIFESHNNLLKLSLKIEHSYCEITNIEIGEIIKNIIIENLDIGYKKESEQIIGKWDSRGKGNYLLKFFCNEKFLTEIRYKAKNEKKIIVEDLKLPCENFKIEFVEEIKLKNRFLKNKIKFNKIFEKEIRLQIQKLTIKSVLCEEEEFKVKSFHIDRLVKIEKNFIIEMKDKNEETPIYDKKHKKIITQEPVGLEKDYERLKIADKYTFEYGELK